MLPSAKLSRDLFQNSVQDYVSQDENVTVNMQNPNPNPKQKSPQPPASWNISQRKKTNCDIVHCHWSFCSRHDACYAIDVPATQ